VPGLGVELDRCSVRLDRKTVLDEVSLRVRPGEKWLLVGANGAGKTQLIKLVAGLRWPTPTGRERRCYRDARGRTVELVDARDRIAYVGAESQDKYSRYGWNFTLEDVVATGLFRTDIPLDRPNAAERRTIGALLARFGLDRLAGRRMLELSYGQRRLALLARALAGRPGLLLLDEVFNGLDDRHRRVLNRVLKRLAQTRMTILASAHRPEDIAPGMSRAAIVEDGRLRVLSMRQAGSRLARRPAASRIRKRDPSGKTARPPFVELRDVWVYRDEVPALRDLDWVLEDGDHWAVTGRNGSGKSTFLGLLYGAYPVALGGRVLRRGHPPGTPLDEIRASLAIVSPDLQAEYDRGSTLAEIVVSGLRDSVGLDGPPSRGERCAAAAALARLGLRALAGRLPWQVSYGELRLALFARAFVKQPAMLLLDEPFTGLDPARRQRLRQALSALARRGTRLVIAIHHRDDLPPEVNRRLHLQQGRGRELPLR